MTRARTTLVIGSGGLLGRSVAGTLERRGDTVVRPRVRWREPDLVHGDLVEGVERLLASADGGPWAVVWSAGVGVTSTTAAQLADELAVLRAFLAALAGRASGPGTGPGALFYASSAGGVYAGSDEPPFTEATTPRPISPYGEAKLEAERALRELCVPAGISVLVGRIANIYGPGQDLAKPQGLVTHLCRGHVTVQPVSVYVSLDTLRDYLYVTDCAEMVADGLERLAGEHDRRPATDGVLVTKIFASQRSVSVGALLAETRRVFGRPPRVLVAASPYAKVQARDLRLRSVVWPELDRRVLVPLPAGIKATVTDIEERMLAARGG